MTAETLILGVGNILMQDEGVGVRVVELLQSRYDLPDSVEVLDGGTAGMELFQPMRGRKHLIIADAVNTGAAPGSLVCLRDDDIPTFFRTRLSPHQLGLSDLLALLQLQGEIPQDITIVGMVPCALENSLYLSTQAETSLPALLDMLLTELKRIGIIPTARPHPQPLFWQRQATL